MSGRRGQRNERDAAGRDRAHSGSRSPLTRRARGRDLHPPAAQLTHAQGSEGGAGAGGRLTFGNCTGSDGTSVGGATGSDGDGTDVVGTETGDDTGTLTFAGGVGSGGVEADVGLLS